jgi:hypothetical protein
MSRRWKPEDRQRTQVRIPQSRLQPTGKRLVDEDRIKIHGNLRHTDPMPLRGNACMKVGQGPGVREPVGFGGKSLQELQDPISAIDEAFEHLPPVIRAVTLRAPLEKPGFGPGCLLDWWQKQEGEVVGGLEMRPLFFELRSTLRIDQR